jgi:hypothetical protein
MIDTDETTNSCTNDQHHQDTSPSQVLDESVRRTIGGCACFSGGLTTRDNTVHACDQGQDVVCWVLVGCVCLVFEETDASVLARVDVLGYTPWGMP